MQLEKYGSEYQLFSWDPLLDIMQEDHRVDNKAVWTKEKVSLVFKLDSASVTCVKYLG